MKKKVFAISFFIGVFALILSVGSLAFFTDKTEEVKNTFTVGKVDIDLTEPEKDNWGVNADGTAKTSLMPGIVYAKTPTVTVKDDSETAYVYAAIELQDAREFTKAVLNAYNEARDGKIPQDSPIVVKFASISNQLNDENVSVNDKLKLILKTILDEFVVGFDNSKWEMISFGINGDTGTFIIAHKNTMKAGDTEKIFTGITMPEVFTSGVFKDTNFELGKIKVTGAAIQAEGFANYIEAGNALAEEWGIEIN